MAKFDGFPSDLFKFLRELKKNNNRDWFNDNKSRYKQSIVEPMSEFISAMAEPLRKISPYYVADPRPHGGSMFRIYRDTRFSGNKSPYKENVGCHFRHKAGKDAHAPGFYVHLEPGNVFFGGGMWMPPNPVLNKIRTMIVVFPKAWEQVVHSKPLLKRLEGVQGDGLQKVPRGFDKEHPFADDLKRKSFYAMQSSNDKLATSKEFIKEVEQAFKAASPLVKFLTKSVELPFD